MSTNVYSLRPSTLETVLNVLPRAHERPAMWAVTFLLIGATHHRITGALGLERVLHALLERHRPPLGQRSLESDMVESLARFG
jgi:hypothetical protein